MRVLTFTSLYPNEVQPRHGIFVKNLMMHFNQISGTSCKVIAPVQYFPLLGLLKNSKYHILSQISAQEEQDNIAIYYPRYLSLPGTGLINVAHAMARSADKIMPLLYPKGQDFDLIDGRYLYPDGVAAYHLAKKHNKPLILTALGSDINFWMEQAKPRAEILESLHYARSVVCVSRALKEKLVHHGIKADKITVLMNGVYEGFFKMASAPPEEKKYLLSIGNLVPLKGHELILHALKNFPDEKLLIIGQGELENHLKNLTSKLGLMDQITFNHHIPHSELPNYYRKARATILMSSMEGMPNVVTESLACGTPVIATNVGGIPEVITEDNGILLKNRTTEDLTKAISSMAKRQWSTETISKSVQHLDWQTTAKQLHHIFEAAL